MEWSPLCNYTHYSLLKGFSKPEELAAKCAENKYKACGIADYKSISGAVSFYLACKRKTSSLLSAVLVMAYRCLPKTKMGGLI